MPKPKKEKTPKPPATGADVMAGMLTEMLDVYERGRYGTVAPTDYTKPSADASVGLRKSYEDTTDPLPWGEIVMSVLVAYRRAGNALTDLPEACAQVAAVWAALGEEPHPQLPDHVPTTSAEFASPPFDA